MRKVSFVLLLLAVLVPRAALSGVTVFAAASLKTVLDRIAEDSGIDLRMVYGGSAAMARQVAAGAQADIVILAHPMWMDWLEEQGAVNRQSRCSLISNRLVLASASAAPFEPKSAEDIIERLEGGRVAVGQLRSVPAGQYTEAFLTGQGWLEAMRPHLAETSNVRLALALIARREVQLGFVYASDVAADEAVHDVYSLPDTAYPKILYPAALTQDAGQDAQAVLSQIAAAQSRFEAQGFTAMSESDAGRCQ